MAVKADDAGVLSHGRKDTDGIYAVRFVYCCLEDQYKYYRRN